MTKTLHLQGQELDQAVHVALGKCPHEFIYNPLQWMVRLDGSTTETALNNTLSECIVCKIRTSSDVRDLATKAQSEWVPRYHDDLQAAWSLVDRLFDYGHTIDLESCGSEWTCRIDQYSYKGIEAREPTVCLAICHAFLLARGTV